MMNLKSKKNWAIVVLMTIGLVAGNAGTNYAILKKHGYKWNKETKQMELPYYNSLVAPFINPNHISSEELDKRIAINNIVWEVIGIVVGTVLHYTIIDRK